ncbi:MAG: glycosyltransferase family 4 protein, partial [Nitrosopumilaceae archaeon]
EYLVSMGASPDKVQIFINTVDTEFFTEATRRIRQHLTPIHDKKRLLYVGELSSRKNVINLLKIMQVLSRTRSDFVLDIVGDGEDGVLLKKYVHENRLTDFVEFHGYKQKPEIPFFMAGAHCFVFPTHFDIWGLVLNEAMVAGLPCLASVHAGATHDLIEDGVTGFAMDFSQTEKVAEKIGWLLENPNDAKQIGQNASRFIAEHASLEKSVSGFVKSIITSMRLKCISSVFSYFPCLY